MSASITRCTVYINDSSQTCTHISNYITSNVAVSCGCVPQVAWKLILDPATFL